MAKKKKQPSLKAVAFQPTDDFLDEWCGQDESLADSFRQFMKKGITWLAAVIDRESSDAYYVCGSLFPNEETAERRARRLLDNYKLRGSFTADDSHALKPVGVSFSAQPIGRANVS